ncbi:MAG TPA: ABC transporter ATP-binding protein [Terriglobales bacterium]|nr:ABC transporter ATP-binding protein [Terriglobales bacterium]
MDPEVRIPEKAEAGSVASLRGVTKKFGAVTALRRIDINVRRGELLSLLGPNGAGKTTAIRLLLGLSRPDSGTAQIFGQDPRSPGARTQIGAMLQVAKVPETLKVREHVDLFRSYYPEPLSFEEIVESAGLEGIEDRLFGELSGGQRQRVLFALAICGNPGLVFLDEPTVGLDVSTRQLMWQQIRRLVRQGRSVLLTTHYMEEVDALADRVIVINQGSVVAKGTSAAIKSRTAMRKIRCVTSLNEDQLRGMPGVSKVSRQESRTELQVMEVEPVLRELFVRDPSIAGLEVSNSSLEEAFLKIIEAENHVQGVTA